jgi:hypothetical protein
MKRSRRLSLLAFLLVFFVTAGALAVTEVVLRWWSLSGAAEKRDHVEATEYLPARFRPDYSGRFWNIPFRTNRYGFRDEPDFPAERPSGEVRVLSLGDSIGFGLGVPADAHYTKVAERLLVAAIPGLRIVNAGGQGYSPSGYFVWLRHEGMRLNPSLVVVEIELCNDLSDEALLQWRTGTDDPWPEAVVGGRYQVAWDGNLLGTYAVGWDLLDRTYLGTVLVRRWLNLWERFGHGEMAEASLYTLGFDRSRLTRERLAAGWERGFGALEAARTLTRDAGIPFLLLVMPSRYLYQNAGELTRSAERLYVRAVQEAERRGLPFVGMRDALGAGGGAGLFLDFAHLTPEGNRVVGEVLAEHLRGILENAARPEPRTF